MAANWIPPNERSRFVSAYLGSSVGAALTFPMCGYLIEWFDWPSVFYATGVIGTIWFLCWWFLVYDTPAKHPYISEKERVYIENCIGDNVTEKKLKTPWLQILLSRSVWMNILAQWGGIWGLFTLLTQAPTYFNNIHGMSVRKTGILSGAPHVCRVLFAVLFSVFGDTLLRKKIMSRTWVRKFATSVCTIVHGLFIMGLAFSGCNSFAAVVCLMLAVGASGAVSTGPLASLVDIGPNFASIILGISNMITVVPGFISPIIVGYLTFQNQTTTQWQMVFIISALMMIVPGILYLLLASSEVQPWNFPEPVTQDYKMKVVPADRTTDDAGIGEEQMRLHNEDREESVNDQNTEKEAHLLSKN
ncbi:Uncharacterized protein GBIM_18143 [Gryllus bimaculatus]|nr:Uncharacterized protein GBIM_18143 [Gryllus bimaculatus]